MHPIPSGRVALCAALALAAPSIWALPAHYRLTDLGAYSDAVSISPAGEIAGTNDRHGRIKAAMWVHGKPRNLVSPFKTAYGHGVNDKGIVVGEVDGKGFQHAAVWHAADDVLDIGHLLGSSHTVATAINGIDDCTVDSVSRQGDHSYIIPVCSSIRVLINIGTLGGTFTTTTAINDHKQVTGTSSLPNGTNHAFLYTQGAMRDLGTMAGDKTSDGVGINDLGHVVGDSAVDQSHFRGFFYDGTAMKPLGGFGGTQTLAFAVNHDDVVVGMVDDAHDEFHAFVIDEGHQGSQMLDLGTMLDSSGAGWNLEGAVGIDADGRILVFGFAPGDEAPRSALLTPAD
jgi:probable HAF family extracellular repeat protein